MPRKGDTITLSFSELSTFSQCPYKHYLEYQKGLIKQRTFNEFASYGTAIHSAAEQLFLLKDIEKAHVIFGEKLSEDWKKHGFAEYDDFYKTGLIVLNKLANHSIVKEHEFLYSELEILHNIKDNIYFKGYIDLLTVDKSKNIVITDFKTTKNGWAKSKLNDIFTKMQLYLYQIFIAQQLELDDLSKIKCQFVFLVSNKKQIEVAELSSTKEELLMAKEIFDSVMNSLYYSSDDKWKLKIKNEWNCKYCDFKNTDNCTNKDGQEGFKLITDEYSCKVVENAGSSSSNLLVIPWRDGIINAAKPTVDYMKQLQSAMSKLQSK